MINLERLTQAIDSPRLWPFVKQTKALGSILFNGKISPRFSLKRMQPSYCRR